MCCQTIMWLGSFFSNLTLTHLTCPWTLWQLMNSSEETTSSKTIAVFLQLSVITKQTIQSPLNTWKSVTYTGKHGYSEHADNKLTLIAKSFSFPETLLPVVNLTDIANYVYNEVNLPVPGISIRVFYCIIYVSLCYHKNMLQMQKKTACM